LNPETFNKFLKKSGLKQQTVASIIKIPAWVLADWKLNKVQLTKRQKNALDDFCDNFCKINSYMAEVQN